MFLARENLDLLVVESATPQVVDGIHALLERDSRVRAAERQSLRPDPAGATLRRAHRDSTYSRAGRLRRLDSKGFLGLRPTRPI